MAEYLVTFAAGASYGLTTMVVGQPLDTIKTRMQALPEARKQSSRTVAIHLFQREGIRGLYRGGLPLFVGGSMMRSAQFGVSGSTKQWLERQEYLPQNFRLFGWLDYQVVLAGIAGGLGRGVVEIPTDFFKTRRQVERGWSIRSVLDGSLATLGRNTVLFTAFIIYIDLSKRACHAGYVPSFLTTRDGSSLTPFAKGAICANLAWFTCWPADVIKSQQQSGNYANRSWLALLMENVRTGKLFRGIIPGLVRSSIANGTSMVVYEYVHTAFTNHFQLERRDMA